MELLGHRRLSVGGGIYTDQVLGEELGGRIIPGQGRSTQTQQKFEEEGQKLEIEGQTDCRELYRSIKVYLT